MNDRDIARLLSQADQQLGIATLCTGQREGRARWVYAVIAPSKYLAFKEAEKQGGYDLRDYIVENGILAHGEGEAPPEEVQKSMEAHGLTPRFAEQLQAILAQSHAEPVSHQQTLEHRAPEKNHPLAI